MYIVIVNVVRTSLSECLFFFGVKLCVEKNVLRLLHRKLHLNKTPCQLVELKSGIFRFDVAQKKTKKSQQPTAV